MSFFINIGILDCLDLWLCLPKWLCAAVIKTQNDTSVKRLVALIEVSYVAALGVQRMSEAPFISTQ